MKKRYAVVAALTLFLCTGFNAFAAPRIYEVSGKKTIEYGNFIDAIKDSKVVFIGETHDDVKQHKEQVEILRSLYAKNPNLAIGLEMFTAENQQQLDDWTSGKVDEQEFKKIYARNWSYDWQLYRDIFIFARDNHVPMIALNVPKPVISKIVRQGHAALSQEEKRLLPPDMSWTLNPSQLGYLKAIRAQTFGNRPAPIPLANFADAQALRNALMGWGVAKFLAKSPGSTVVVIAGTWHAIKNGAPEQLKQYRKTDSKVVLPELSEFVIEKARTDEADYFILR